MAPARTAFPLLKMPPEMVVKVIRMLRLEPFPALPQQLDDPEYPSMGCDTDDERRFHREALCVKALARLSRSCRFLYLIAQEHLYYRPTTRRYMSLMRTLIERPDLARMVRHLNLGPPIVADFAAPDPRVEEYCSKYLWDQPVRAIQLPTLCPNIETLEGVLYEPRCWDFTIAYLSGLLPLLKRIIIWSGPSASVLLDPLRMPFVAAPNVEEVIVHSMTDCSYPLARMPTVKSMGLFHCDITSGTLTEIFDACPGVERLRYEARGCGSVGKPTPPGYLQFSPMEAADAIVQSARNLKEFYMNMTRDLDGIWDWEEVDDSFVFFDCLGIKFSFESGWIFELFGTDF